MEDYEIRDALSRSKAPNLISRWKLPDPDIRLANVDESDYVELQFTLNNTSPEPSLYTTSRAFLDVRLKNVQSGFSLRPEVIRAPDGTKCSVLDLKTLGAAALSHYQRLRGSGRHLQLHNISDPSMPHSFAIGLSLRAPGFSKDSWASLNLEGGRLKIVEGSD
jgi:hypothetical protein